MMWFGGGWMILWMLLFWAGLIVLVVWGRASPLRRESNRRPYRPE
jgi:uncharacterized protein (DUF58 family)